MNNCEIGDVDSFPNLYAGLKRKMRIECAQTEIYFLFLLSALFAFPFFPLENLKSSVQCNIRHVATQKNQVEGLVQSVYRDLKGDKVNGTKA